MSKKIIVIGANSFSAGSFINLLLNKKFYVIGISRSKKNKSCFLNFDFNHKRFKFYQYDINIHRKKIINLIKKNKPKYVVNYASQSMVGQSWENPKDWFITNSVSLPLLYKDIFDLKIITRLLHISTPEIYGSNSKKISENQKYQPNTPYAISRTTADFFLNIMHKNKAAPYVSVRASNVYGEYQKMYRIIPKAVSFFSQNRKINLEGGGKSKRSFIHIDDVSEATLLVLLKGKNGSIYHVSGDDLISIKNLLIKIATILNVDFHKLVKISPDRIGKDSFYFLNNSEIKKLGWKQKISLDEGIKKVIRWNQKYKNIIKESDYKYLHKK